MSFCLLAWVVCTLADLYHQQRQKRELKKLQCLLKNNLHRILLSGKRVWSLLVWGGCSLGGVILHADPVKSRVYFEHFLVSFWFTSKCTALTCTLKTRPSVRIIKHETCLSLLSFSQCLVIVWTQHNPVPIIMPSPRFHSYDMVSDMI